MAIHTHDPELTGAIDFLVNKFPKTLLHGELLRDTYPKKYDKVDCNGTIMIVWKGKLGDDNCLNYCRESVIKRRNKWLLEAS